MHKEDIKSVIRKRHGTLTEFERVRGLPAGSVKDVLRGRSVARAEAAIADVLKLPIQKVFPRRYGRPDSSTKVDDSKPKVAAHRLSERAV